MQEPPEGLPACHRNQQAADCRTTLAPVLALTLSRTGQYLHTQMHPVARKLARCGESLLHWLASGRDVRPSSIVKALLLLLLSALALVLSLTSFSLGRAIATKVEEIVTNTGALEAFDYVLLLCVRVAQAATV